MERTKITLKKHNLRLGLFVFVTLGTGLEAVGVYRQGRRPSGRLRGYHPIVRTHPKATPRYATSRGCRVRLEGWYRRIS